MFKNVSKKKRFMVLMSTIAVFAILLLTFAWDVYKSSKENKFGNAIAAGSIVVEEYFPDGKIPEGGKVEKQVWGVNTSQTAVLMRMTFEERLRTLIAEGNTNSAKVVKVADAAAKPDKAIPFPIDAVYYATEAKLGDAAQVTDSVGKWANITSQVKVGGANIPTDVVVLGKSTKEKITAVGNTVTYKVSTEYAAFKKVKLEDTNMGDVSKQAVVKYPGATDSIAQRVDLEGFKPKFDVSTGDITGFEATNINYVYYEGLSAPVLANWGNAPKDINLGGTESPILPADAKTSAKDKNLTYDYKHLSDTIEKGKWIYNPEDGYFYYLGVVGSGAKTSNVLDKVGLKNGSGTIYDYFDYSLFVDLEGILPEEEAVTAEFFKGTKPTAGKSKDIYDALVTYITDFKTNQTTQTPLP
ncbi:hypothetical protein [Vagococcus silagei]|uniref:Uncharacterized protein n=1 Tax=Vagococcus silagei TaxID=2508885 RepID=A0A4S3B2R6_9ENTE|nr:hypothetical protein [Vagococcus silagei]THB60698.1 hypothetical protein ESZ54_08890 [Vagococcus silagei]